jgi:hypothetical protein
MFMGLQGWSIVSAFLRMQFISLNILSTFWFHEEECDSSSSWHVLSLLIHMEGIAEYGISIFYQV